MMMTPDVNVCVIDFKDIKGNELVTPNEDGSYTILINARLSYEMQLESYEHAMKHIKNEDFQKTDTQAIETIAHDIVTPLKKERLSDFHQRILEEIRKSRKRIQKELKKIDERNSWMMDHDPEFFDRMEGTFLESQRLGDY